MMFKQEDEMTEIESLKEEIERLRSLLRQCVPGPDVVEISPGEVLGLHLALKGESFADIRDRLRAGNAA
jgi:hypothetical protein